MTTSAHPAPVTGVASGISRRARIISPRRTSVEHASTPRPADGQVLVRLEGCGVCASNLPVWEGREWFGYPQEPGAPGHEGWGCIEAVGSAVEGLEVGQRVAALSYHAFAEHDLADASAVVPLPDALDGEPFPGEPLGCAVNVIDRAGIAAGQTVAIIGIGFLGALLTQLACRAGANVIAISRRRYALDVARRCGAGETVVMDDHARIIERVSALTGGRWCDRVIEAVGAQWPLDLAAELTAERGRLIIGGFHQDGLRQVNVQLWNWRGLDVINAHERDQRTYVEGMRRAVQLVIDGTLDPSLLYTHFVPLERADDAFATVIERPDGFMKALVTT